MNSVGDSGPNKIVAFNKVDGDNAGLSLILEIADRRLLDCTVGCCHKYIQVFLEVLVGNRKNHGNFFVVKFEKVDDRTALGVGRTFRQVPNVEPEHSALIGEAEKNIVCRGNEELADDISFFNLGSFSALTASFLSTVFGGSLTLDIAGVGHGNVAFLNFTQISGNLLLHQIAVVEQGDQLMNLFSQFCVIFFDAFMF